MTAALSAPLRVTWDMTTRCNLSCIHCYNSSRPNARMQLKYLEVQLQFLMLSFLLELDELYRGPRWYQAYTESVDSFRDINYMVNVQRNTHID